MLRRLSAILALTAMIATLLPTSNTMAQVIPNPIAPAPGAPVEAPVRVPVPPAASPEYGVGAYLMGYPETTDRDIGLITGASFQWVKLTVPWRSVEASCKGCIDWDDLDRVVLAASTAGLKIMARVDHPPAWARAIPAENGPPDDPYDYADFVGEMARRYANGSPKGTIQAIQIWNEPNLSREWGGTGVEPIIDRRAAVQYMSLLRQSYTEIKAKDPTKIVVSAGLSPTGTNDGTAIEDTTYLEWLYENDLDDNSDAIGVHAPGYGSAPEAEVNSNPAFPHPSFYFRRVEQLHDIMVKNGDVNKQVWVLEFGWTTDTVHPDRAFYAVTPEQQADYIVRAFQYAKANWSPWIGPMMVWNMPDPTWTADNEQLYWSITGTDGAPRPAYTAIQTARANGTLP
jgi:polysaccharide biosynthesis protein PslG